jgi:hypothetical protein
MKLPELPQKLAPATRAGPRRPPRRAAPPFGPGWSLDVVLLSFLAAAPTPARPRRRARPSGSRSSRPQSREG